MERLNCSMCGELVAGGLDGLLRHFTENHGLTINRGMENTGFECGQNGCRRTFVNFYSLRRHIRKRHLAEEDNGFDGIPERVFYLPQDELDDDDVEMFVNDVENVNENPVVVDNDVDFDFRKFIIGMIARFQCKGSMTGRTLTQVLDECEELLLQTRDFLKAKVKKVLQEKNVLDELGLQDVLQIFQFDSPFRGLRTLDQQIEALKNNCGYIEPIEMPLGYRVDDALDHETGMYIPKITMETCQYIPIINTLKLVLSSKDVREVITSEEKSADGVLASFLDGEHAKIHPFFLQHKHALRIQLYYDELEIVNPLGSKTGVHKLGAFYYTIQNLPSHMNSELSSIHVLLLCCDADVKKYGFKKILGPFLHDLARLESDEGVLVQGQDYEFVLRASIAAFCGDGLSVHDVFNLLGPSANKFCRLCLYTRNDLHAGSLEVAQPRTEDVFDNHLALLEATDFSAESKSATGVRGHCCLHSSRYFHIARNKIFDPMHDFLCGLCHMILKLVLREYILVQRKFTTKYFNGKILSFQYGFVEKVNKPSANLTEAMLRKKEHSLSQKAMQMWCLVRVFPFLLSEKVQNGDDHMRLVLDLLRIMELVFAPKITKSLLPYLTALIETLISNFITLFPDVHLINKFHHLTHYPECISWAGPLVHYYCMRYEAKHGDLKQRAQNVRNFKNPPKTLIRVSQCGQSAKWGSKNVKIFRLQALNGKSTPVEITQSRDGLHHLGYVDTDKVFCSKSVKVNGVEYRPGLFVCLEVAHVRVDNLPLFGRIQEIVVLGDTEVYLKISVCTSIFDTDLNAYRIEFGKPHGSFRFIGTSDLAYFKPFCCWTLSTSDGLYISLRHILM